MKHVKPKPVFHLAGENDPLVRFKWQERTIAGLRKLNGCGEGTPWADHCTLYPSKSGTPVVTYIHAGGHQLPDDVPPLIVKFFKQQVNRVAASVSITAGDDIAGYDPAQDVDLYEYWLADEWQEG